MQTTGRTANRGAGTIYNFTTGARCANINRQKTKNSGTIGNSNDFLKVYFNPIAPSSVVRDWSGKDYNYITQENYEFLRDSFLNYAQLLNRKVNHYPGKSIGEGIANLYKEMNLLIGDALELNIESRMDKLYFNIWKNHQWGEYSLYWFPIIFIEKLPAGLRRIVISFLHQLMRNNNFDVMTKDSYLYYEFDYILDWVSESNCDNDEREQKKVIDLIQSYRDGRISKLLKRVDEKCYYKDLSAAFGKYEPRNYFERELISIMTEGIQFIGEDKHSIMNYSYDPYNEDEPESYPIGLDQQILIIYDSHDIITETCISTFNSQLQESYEIIPTTTLELSPDTKTLFTMDEYPERFFQWADKFIDLINYKYE